MIKEIQKIFIANRGEIAVRIIKTAKELGIKTVCTFTSDDAESLHVSLADRAIPLGDQSLSETFLSAEKMVQLALDNNCDAIHPGYGFLSENYEFAQQCHLNNIIFIGPSSKVIRRMGNKLEARNLAKSLGIPIIKGLTGTADELKDEALLIEFPLIIKAVAGGGGKAMHIVENIENLLSSLEKAEREAVNYFGDGSLFVEHYIQKARHIEVQILGDKHGNIVHLFERECSVQRRHQKLIEEAPATSVTEKLKKQLYKSALKIGEAVGYENAGTVEFLVDEEENFYFLEMNTRIQVEHGVTEKITGIDIVKEQILISSGLPLSFTQNQIQQKGHAIEARIYAEDPAKNFIPVLGTINKVNFPQMVNTRIDTHLTNGMLLSRKYDPLLAKVIAFGETRKNAITQIRSLLNNSILFGVKNNSEILSKIISSDDFKKNEIFTSWLGENMDNLILGLTKEKSMYFNEVVIAYLIFYFISPKQNPKNIWEQIGYWKNKLETEIFILNQKYSVSLIKNDDRTEILINDQQINLSCYQTSNHGILFHLKNHTYQPTIYQDDDCTRIHIHGFTYKVRSQHILSEARIEKEKKNSQIRVNEKLLSPLFGKVVKVNMKEGEKVKQGETVIVIESMKMENNILCPADGLVDTILVKEGEVIKENEVLVKINYNIVTIL